MGNPNAGLIFLFNLKITLLTQHLGLSTFDRTLGYANPAFRVQNQVLLFVFRFTRIKMTVFSLHDSTHYHEVL